MMCRYAYGQSLYAILHAWLLIYGSSLLICTKPREEENVHTTLVLLMFSFFIQIPTPPPKEN
jgi:hypothetical protein